MFMRWGKTMEDDTFNALQFCDVSPDQFLGYTIHGVEPLINDGDVEQLFLYVTATDGTEKTLCIYIDGMRPGCELNISAAEIPKRL